MEIQSKGKGRVILHTLAQEKKNQNNLVAWYTNADVLTREKIIELTYRLENSIETPDIISIVEVKPKHYNRELDLKEYSIEGYNLEDNLTQVESGRGIIMYIRDSLPYKFIQPSVRFDEALLIEIPIDIEIRLLIATIYRSPST